ncbi:hypothetical protein BDZ91DRAFT_709175 [Kalaharituber pfeilii]|nr:hypothetical protein BDZ91DRAFT_709175 [Kalaharituber pfeilii]
MTGKFVNVTSRANATAPVHVPVHVPVSSPAKDNNTLIITTTSPVANSYAYNDEEGAEDVEDDYTTSKGETSTEDTVLVSQMLSITQVEAMCLFYPTAANRAICACIVEGFHRNDIALISSDCLREVLQRNEVSPGYPTSPVAVIPHASSISADDTTATSPITGLHAAPYIHKRSAISQSPYCPATFSNGDIHVMDTSCIPAPGVTELLEIQAQVDVARERMRQDNVGMEAKMEGGEIQMEKVFGYPEDEGDVEEMIGRMSEDELLGFLESMEREFGFI